MAKLLNVKRQEEPTLVALTRIEKKYWKKKFLMTTPNYWGKKPSVPFKSKIPNDLGIKKVAIEDEFFLK